MDFTFRIGAGLLVAVSSLTSFASSVSAVCARNQVANLVITDRWPSPAETPNVCLRDESLLSGAELQTINDLGSFHQKAATFFTLPIESVFPKGVVVYMIGSDFGPVGAAAGPSALNMTFFPPFTNQRINESIYLHELGHYLSLQTNPALPAVFQRVNQGPFFQETFADTFALALTDQVIAPEDDMPGCLSNLRRIMSFQSYRYPKGYFDETFTFRRIQACCSYLLGKQKPLPTATEAFCKSPDVNVQLPPLDRSKLSFEPLQKMENFSHTWMETIDPHQFGIPLNSFLYNLSRETHRPIKSLVLPALNRGMEPRFAQRLHCRFEKDGLEAEAEVSNPSFFAIIRSIREEMATDEERATFDRLWERHAMDQGAALYENETMTISTIQFVNGLTDQPKFQAAAFGCMDSFRSSQYADPSCHLLCERIN